MENKSTGNDYPIPTRDVVTGDEITFERAVFTGTYPKAKFSHHEQIIGTVIRESYGEEKQQHTFTIRRQDGTLLRIKGRNLYRGNVYRARWQDEQEREVIADEKHQRGRAARTIRAIRRGY